MNARELTTFLELRGFDIRAGGHRCPGRWLDWLGHKWLTVRQLEMAGASQVREYTAQRCCHCLMENPQFTRIYETSRQERAS